MVPQYLLDLFAHMEWADSVVWRAVLATPSAENDSRLRELLHHVHGVQRGFLSCWTGEKPRFDKLEDFPDLAALARWGRDFHNAASAHLASVDERALESVKEVPWRNWVVQAIGREPHPTTLRDTLIQVSQHSTYHRAQVNARLRELGATPPLTDYIAWVWMGKPGAEWP